jgi:hypothetical protein
MTTPNVTNEERQADPLETDFPWFSEELANRLSNGRIFDQIELLRAELEWAKNQLLRKVAEALLEQNPPDRQASLEWLASWKEE